MRTEDGRLKPGVAAIAIAAILDGLVAAAPDAESGKVIGVARKVAELRSIRNELDKHPLATLPRPDPDQVLRDGRAALGRRVRNRHATSRS